MNLQPKTFERFLRFDSTALFIIGAVLLTLQTGVVTAAPKTAPKTKTANNMSLQFNVFARVVSIENGKANSDLPAQTIAARVSIKGESARIETEARSQPSIFLLTPSTFTKLLPKSRAGVRWKIDATALNSTVNATSTRLTVQSLWNNPSKLRAALVSNGAKLSGKALLNGVPVDIYKAARFGGKKQEVVAWLRRSDALPLRIQTISPTLSSTLSWTNYRRVALSDAFFRVPTGYAMREGSGQPYL